MPYVGRLRHKDFACPMTEIEPEEPEKLDKLYENQDTFVIGCEPFAHYSGIKKLEKIGHGSKPGNNCGGKFPNLPAVDQAS